MTIFSLLLNIFNSPIKYICCCFCFVCLFVLLFCCFVCCCFLFVSLFDVLVVVILKINPKFLLAKTSSLS